jgi:hypothetical protein
LTDINSDLRDWKDYSKQAVNMNTATTNAQHQANPDPTDLVKAEDLEIQKTFRREWPTITSPEPPTLLGFRRFQTTHLLNLRILENEILAIDHKVFQAGLSLGGEVRGESRSDDFLTMQHLQLWTKIRSFGYE